MVGVDGADHQKRAALGSPFSLRSGDDSCRQKNLLPTTESRSQYAIVNYINWKINPKMTVGFRSDLLDDRKGQRTGIATKYAENTLYATRYFGSTVILQPEIRFDHSWDRLGYNGGTARNQFFVGADLIYKF